MLKKRIIPCLDVNNGRVVKGVNFINLIDAGDPVEQAIIYNEEGADELCFLDITASSDNRSTLFDVVKKTAENCFIPLLQLGEEYEPWMIYQHFFTQVQIKYLLIQRL